MKKQKGAVYLDLEKLNKLRKNNQSIFINKDSKERSEMISFWLSIQKPEIDAIKDDQVLLLALHNLVNQDSIFYLARTEVNGMSVFCNKKGCVKLPVTSLKLGTKVQM